MNESNKFKYGMVFLVLGVLLVVWAWGSWTLRVVPEPASDSMYEPAHDLDNESGEADDSVEPDKAKTLEGSFTQKNKANINAWRYLLFVLLGLFLIVLFGSYFLLRIARRYRARAAHDRAPPTPFEDVWSSHKLPKE